MTSYAITRLHEEAAEELGRLDALVAVAPGAVSTALRVVAMAGLAAETPEATRAGAASLVAAGVDVVHAAALADGLETWRDRVDDGERRARSGAPLLVADAAWAPAARGVDPLVARAAIDDALRPGAELRPLLTRALQVAAWVPEVSEGELLAALLLTAGGLTDRIRVLPFAALSGAARDEAAQAWRDGDPEPLVRAALPSLAARARQLRLQVRLLLDAQSAEDEHLASIGRAAVTGRRVLALLRRDLATSVPALSERLALSRPAAGAALERLAELGLAEEITGRARDRVFVYAAAWGLM